MGILVDPDLVQHDMTIKGSPKVKSTRSKGYKGHVARERLENNDLVCLCNSEESEGL